MNTKEVAEWLREAAVRCEDLRDIMDDRNEISTSSYYADEANAFRQRASRVEAMTCDRCADFDNQFNDCLDSFDASFENGANIEKCGPKFGCNRWK